MHPLNIDKTLAEINATYEAAVLKHIAETDADTAYQIDLSEPFFGIEWGVVEGNVQRQKWRWLGPRGQSHLFLKLSTATDHLIRVYIHTATSGQVLQALTALVNGTRCAQQGQDWGADGVASHWCLVNRELLAKHQGVAKITWSLLRTEETPRATLNSVPGQPTHARSIAFSRIKCEPYPVS